MLNAATVLLSGGLDSAAALLWACRNYMDVRAIAFDYGQPNVARELPAAQRLAESFSVPFVRLSLADALNPSPLRSATAHDTPTDRTHRAFMPGRNMLFLTLAAAHSALWTAGPLTLVIGACSEDAAGFPDCRRDFFDAAERALTIGIGHRPVNVHAPYIEHTKAGMLRLQTPEHLAILAAETWSCYRGGELPCGVCSPCVLRAAGFAALAL